MAVYNIDGNIIASLGGGASSPFSNIFLENHLIAHKGGNAGAANTITNFESGIANGYKMLEGDVRFTKDSVPVLSHDASISGYSISSYTYDELIAFVPTLAKLEEFLMLCKRENAVSELDFTKEYSLEQSQICYDTVKMCGMIERTMFTAYANTCRALISIDSNIIICVSGIDTTEKIDGISDIITGAALCVCSIGYGDVTRNIVDYMHNAGCKCKPWTVNSVATINTLFEYGADYIITDSVLPSSV